MIAWALPLLPWLVGGLVWRLGRRIPAGRTWRRAALGAGAVAGLVATVALAGWGAAVRPDVPALPWIEGLALTLRVTPMVGVAAVVPPVIAIPVLAWAAAHEDAHGLPRLLGLLVAFVGAMELLVLAGDLLVLALAWELVSALSFLLISQQWRVPRNAAAASYAFVATRLGGLGLWVAAAASLAATGSLAFEALPRVASSPWGHALAGGILLAAAAKSAQGPFAPWLFRAMEGPSSVSALLHSSTMVAAGAWLLVRLHEPLALVPWLPPAAVALGLLTALAGGVVALWQPHAKRLLAASTSAQHGLVIAAVGLGSAGAGAAHLVAHAAAKSLSFLAAGMAITVAGRPALAELRLGRRLPFVALVSAVGALALAGMPPLGMAWTKELVVAAAEHASIPLALLVLVAGVLGAAYATRFQRLAFGPPSCTRPADREPVRGVGMVSRASIVALALLCIGLGVAWLPGLDARLRAVIPQAPPPGAAWLLVLSVASVGLAIVTVWIADRRRALEPPALPSRARTVVADWLGLPAALRVLLIRPTRRLARACACFDEHAGRALATALASTACRLARAVGTRLDRGLARAGRVAARVTVVLALVVRELDRGLARAGPLAARATLASARAARQLDRRGFASAAHALATAIGRAASASRRLQTGAVPTYYAIVVVGAVALGLALQLGS